MASEPHARPDCRIDDPARALGDQAAAEAPESGEPTLDGAFSVDGVDLTVIRWMLRRTAGERLEAAQQVIDAAWALRGDEA